MNTQKFHRKLNQSIRVRVPATSANLGPGFDALGLALDLADEIEVEFTPVVGRAHPRTKVHVTGQGAGTIATDDRHLVVQAMRRTLELAGAAQPNITLKCVNRIPHGRGLGSSAAAVVAGITAAEAYLNGTADIDRHRVLALATDFEGHPDNAAPAIYGGATVAWMDEGSQPQTESHGSVSSNGRAKTKVMPQAANFTITSEIVPTVLIPTATLATKTARAVLPASVPHHDAAFNAGRAALLVTALNDHPNLLFPATEDRLHQAQRASKMPESARVLAALRERGFAAVISGAGPTVLVLTPKKQIPELDGALREIIGTAPDDNEPVTTMAGKWEAIRPGLDKNGTVARLII